MYKFIRKPIWFYIALLAVFFHIVNIEVYYEYDESFDDTPNETIDQEVFNLT